MKALSLKSSTFSGEYLYEAELSTWVAIQSGTIRNSLKMLFATKSIRWLLFSRLSCTSNFAFSSISISCWFHWLSFFQSYKLVSSKNSIWHHRRRNRWFPFLSVNCFYFNNQNQTLGFLITYVGPLVFVLSVTILKEAFDDFKRFLRDKEANSQIYKKLMPDGNTINIPSSDIKVGDFIILEKNQRVKQIKQQMQTKPSNSFLGNEKKKKRCLVTWFFYEPLNQTEVVSSGLIN